MDNDNLTKIAGSLLSFLFAIKNNVFNEDACIKNFPNHPKEIDNYIDKFPMPPSHIKVILYLSKSNSSSISQIANSLNISKSNMTPIIDNLIKWDIVNRYPDPNDRRILRVELTPEAIHVFEQFKEFTINKLIEKISLLSDEDLQILDTSVSNMTNIISKLK